MSLAARHLEENGIPTVVIGCAKDIVEYVGVPRFLFSDFPLGNPAGRPHDPKSQMLTLELALRVLGTAPASRTTVQSPLRWSAVPAGSSISQYRPAVAEEIARRRAEFDRQKESRRRSARSRRQRNSRVGLCREYPILTLPRERGGIIKLRSCVLLDGEPRRVMGRSGIVWRRFSFHELGRPADYTGFLIDEFAMQIRALSEALAGCEEQACYPHYGAAAGET